MGMALVYSTDAISLRTFQTGKHYNAGPRAPQGTAILPFISAAACRAAGNMSQCFARALQQILQRQTDNGQWLIL
jgi:hypothetical protein